jgi:hypothetical protein
MVVMGVRGVVELKAVMVQLSRGLVRAGWGRGAARATAPTPHWLCCFSRLRALPSFFQHQYRVDVVRQFQ